MIRQEINEIKKLYTINNCSVTRICGCYVDGEKNIKDKWAKAFLSMDEEDLFKYLEIFRKCLSSGLEKNLINISLTKETVKEQLLAVRNSRLKNEELLDAFYEHIIDTYEYVGNYLILVIHDVYDVPGKTRDGIEMEDASDEVYEYILACICPVNLSTPGLGYDKDQNTFTHVERDWMLAQPHLALLYPAFNDRAEDRDAALVYANKLEQSDKDFIAMTLGHTINLTHNEEKEAFESILQETLGAAELKEVKSIQHTMLELAVEHTHDPEPLKLDKQEIAEILNKSGISAGKMQCFEQAFHGYEGEKYTLDNIVNRKSFSVDTDNASIRMKPEYADEICIREVDGRMCLVLNIIGELTVNGIQISVGEA